MIADDSRPYTGGKASVTGLPLRSTIYNAALLLVIFALSVRYQVKLFNYGFWQDEFETMIASKMMASGLRLYDTVFNQHGPLIFAFGTALDAVTDTTIAGYRTIIAVLQWLLIGCLLIASRMTPPATRSLGLTIVAVLLVAGLPQVFGHMFMYQTVAGLFAAAAMALLCLPVLQGEHVSRWRALVGGFLLGCLPFLAFTYALASAGLLVCSLTRATWRGVASGVIVAVLLNAAFIVSRCSLGGFIAEHLYLNIAIYPAFGDNSFARTWGEAHKVTVLAAATGMALLVVTMARIAMQRRTGLWRSAVLGLAVTSFLARGPHFHAIPFYYAMLPLIMTGTSWIRWTGPVRSSVRVVVTLACLAELSLLLPFDVRRIEAGQIPRHSAFSDIVQKHTLPSDRIISYSFDNFEYIVSHRLPAASEFYWLPQESVYNEHPVLGVVLDACEQIRRNPPKFIKLDKWLAWKKYPWTSYGACVDEIVDKSYHNMKDTPIYVRNDLWPLEPHLSGSAADDGRPQPNL